MIKCMMKSVGDILNEKAAGKIILPDVQRNGKLWPEDKQKEYTFCIEQEKLTPALMLESLPNGSCNLMDGQQRVCAMEANPTPKLLQSMVPVIIYEGKPLSNRERGITFRNVNNGVPVTPAEIRHAHLSKFSRGIEDITEHSSYFINMVSGDNKRYAKDEMLAQFVLSLITAGSTGSPPNYCCEVRSHNLDDLYDEHRSNTGLLGGAKDVVDILDTVPAPLKKFRKVLAIDALCMGHYILNIKLQAGKTLCLDTFLEDIRTEFLAITKDTTLGRQAIKIAFGSGTAAVESRMMRWAYWKEWIDSGLNAGRWQV